MMEYIDCNYAVRILDQVSSSPGKISYISHHCTSILTKFRMYLITVQGLTMCR